MERLQQLFRGYLDGRLTADEYTELWRLMEQQEGLEDLSPELKTLWQEKPVFGLPDNHWDQRLSELQAEGKPAVKRTIAAWRYAAAAVVIFLVAGSYFYFQNPQQNQLAPTAMAHDVKPGTTGAILSFDNGKTIVLDTARDGQLTDGVTKSDQNITIQGSSIEYATVTTPRGRQQQLTLQDGSKVWLNSASSIRFPSLFTGDTRQVEITGEAYFEVAKNAAKPFIVKIGEASIEVLGTHFNVMAYANENSLQTTLIEGSVKFHKGDKSVLLKPGEQSRLFANNEIKLLRDADVDLATAWKNGQQTFKEADMATVMRQVERWYDVDVEYQTDVPRNLTFTGEGISRNVNLSELLQVFESKQVHFEIDGVNRKVIVKK
ncbi:MAG: FecR domain-containing protein [Sediminibacterium sp.]